MLAVGKYERVGSLSLLTLSLIATVLLVARSLAPFPHDRLERYWLASLGQAILATRAIPHVLTPAGVQTGDLPWTPHEWLFATAVAFAQAHGVYAVFAAAVGVLVSAVFWIFLWSCRSRGVHPLLAAVACYVALLVVQQFYEVRVAAVSWLFFVLLIVVLDRVRLRWWLAPLGLFWANVHASVVLGVAIAIAYAGAQALERRPVRLLAVQVVAMIGATLCTPFGVGLYAYALATAHAAWHPYVDEWRPLWQSSIGWYLPWLLLLPLILSGRWKRPPMWEPVVVIVMMVAAAMAVRNAIPFVLIAMPIVLSWKEIAFPRYAQLCAAGVVLCTLVLQCRLPSHVVRDAPFGIWVPSTSAARLVGFHFAGKRVFCDRAPTCNVALFEHAATYLDGRVDPFPVSVFQETATIDRARPGWSARLRDLRIDAVVTSEGDPIEQALTRSSEWSIAYAAGGNTVFVPRVDVIDGRGVFTMRPSAAIPGG